MLVGVSQQVAGLAIISTYSTCVYCLPLDSGAGTNVIDFFSLVGLTDPFLGTVIIS